MERGFVNLKGKGEQRTYWLLGEDQYCRQLRTQQRKIRRGIYTDRPQSNGHVITRSSLKTKSNSTRSPIPRCSSFESPKRLRFANPDLLEVISDDSPSKKTSCCSDCRNGWKGCSSSCPCIEELSSFTNIAPSLTKSNRTESYPKTCCSSVPTLYPHLAVPHQPVIHTLSAPSSPRKPDGYVDSRLAKFPECEEVIPWPDSTPLLKITEPQSYEANA